MTVKFKTGRLAMLGAVLFTGAALVVGCGGDSESDDGDFVASANAICADFDKQSKTMEADFTAAIENGNLEAGAGIFEEQAELMTGALDEMEALEVPADTQDTMDEFIALGRETTDLTLEAAEAIRADDGEALQAAVSESESIDAESDALAEEAGLTDCVNKDGEEV